VTDGKQRKSPGGFASQRGADNSAIAAAAARAGPSRWKSPNMGNFYESAAAMDAAVNLAYGMSRICRGAASGSTIGAPGRTDAAAKKRDSERPG
jgi:hypothetical protein